MKFNLTAALLKRGYSEEEHQEDHGWQFSSRDARRGWVLAPRFLFDCFDALFVLTKSEDANEQKAEDVFFYRPGRVVLRPDVGACAKS
jgi:hypothetical protein